ncbi:MAG: GNAT family N-acetyltransferase [Rhizomicrobium sp.]
MAAGPYFLTTARLGFRIWTIEDLPLALTLWGDPRVTRLIGGPFSEAAIKKKLEAEISAMAGLNVQYWPSFLLATGEHAGCAGLRAYKPEEQIYELGFHFRPDHWGKGFAEEAGRAIIRYAFTVLAVKDLFAGHHPGNAASRRVLEKLGFRFQGEELYPPTGLKHPSYLLMQSGK